MKKRIKAKNAFNVERFCKKETRGPRKREKIYGTDTQIRLPYYQKSTILLTKIIHSLNHYERNRKTK